MGFMQRIKFENYVDFQKEFDLYISEDCSQICNEYKKAGEFLYRATKGFWKDFDKKIPRTDRKPLSTDPKLSEKFDEQFNKLFGWKPRKEGIFCQSDVTDINIYGDEDFIVFPKNGFKFLWSEHVEDLWATLISIKYGLVSYDINPNVLLNKVSDALRDEYKKGGPTLGSREEYIKKFEDEYHKNADKIIRELVATYRETNMKRAIQTGNEVMIKCEFYRVISNTNPQRDYVAKALGM